MTNAATAPAPLLFIDSGVGGITIWQHVRAALPTASTLYIADNQYFPYGEQTETTIVERVMHLAETFRSLQPSALIVACNTASTLVLPHLRRAWQQPVIGVVPAIKTAAQLTRNKRIGLLATPGTVQRQYIDRLIADHASDCQVHRIGSSKLVQWAEAAVAGKPPQLQQVRKLLMPFIEADIDVGVLGCTHFPLLRGTLESAAPQIQWVDSGEAIARRVHQLLGLSLSRTLAGKAPSHRFFHTGAPVSSGWLDTIKAFGFNELSEWSLVAS